MFSTIGIIGKPHHAGASESVTVLVDYLRNKGCHIILDERMSIDPIPMGVETTCLATIGESADLAIVIGGDGNMLGAARVLSQFDISVVGINRGNLGFLTDIDPDNIVPELDFLFNDDYVLEERFLLEIEVYREGKIQSNNLAMNEAILHHSNVANMIEFEVYIDEQFVFSQRADGLIISTPTGSTAYSMSAGGPIVTPKLSALTLVPMFPHSLTSRPLLVDADSCITLIAVTRNHDHCQVSCDGHGILAVQPGDQVRIKKAPHTLSLVHPPTYDYYRVLRNKLGWGSKLY